MMFFRLSLVVATVLFSNCADAGRIPRGSTPGHGAQLNVGGQDFAQTNFLNVLPVGSISYSGGATPGTAAVDTNGYPTQSFTGTINVNYGNQFWPGVYVASWGAGTQLQIVNVGSNTGCSVSGTGGSFTGCSNSNVNLTVNGTGAGSMTFTPTGGFSIQFPGSGTYGAAGTASLTISRIGDVGRSPYFTPEYLAVQTGAGAYTIRTMGWDNTNGGNTVSYASNYRPKPTNIGWQNIFPLSAWSGGINSAGTIANTGAAYTAAAATDTNLSGWVDGEAIQGNITNAQAAQITVSNAVNNGSGLCRLTVSSSATLTTGQQVWVSDLIDDSAQDIMRACSNITPTITVINSTTIDLQGTTFGGTYSRGGTVGTQTLAITGKPGGTQKFIGDLNGVPVADLAPGFSTFSYSAILDKVLYSPNGFIGGVPIEVEANLCNQLNANCWNNLSAYATNAQAQQWATLWHANLNANLFWYPQRGNENWNFQFPSTQWATQSGLALGFPIGSEQATYSFEALRHVQIFGSVIPTVWSDRLSQLRRTLPHWALDNGFSGQVKTYLLSGSLLAPSGVGTGAGNALYCTYTGGTFSGSTCTGGGNYTTSPNQPQNFAESIGGAPYIGGANIFYGPDVCLNCTPNSANAVFYQAVINDWDAGNTAGAVALIDGDIRQGRTNVQGVTASGTTFTTPLAHGFNNGTAVSFQVTGGTPSSGIPITGQAYVVSSTSSAGCSGGVVCNFTLQALVNGLPSGANVNAGTAGTGTMTVCSIGSPTSSGNVFTLQYAANTYYPFFEGLASSFDVSRAANGQAPLRNEWYEGAPEMIGPQVPQCTALGLTSTTPSFTFTGNTNATTGFPGANTISNISTSQMTGIVIGASISGSGIPANTTITSIAENAVNISANATTTAPETLTLSGAPTMACSVIQQAIFAWRNDPSAAASIQAYYKQFVGSDPTMVPSFGLMSHAKTPAHLVLPGPFFQPGAVWGLLSDDFPNSTPTQLYYGFGAWRANTNWLLKRDLDPSSNDNEPMFLEKAA
jgi:hypothetical protein